MTLRLLSIISTRVVEWSVGVLCNVATWVHFPRYGAMPRVKKLHDRLLHSQLTLMIVLHVSTGPILDRCTVQERG